MLSPEMTERIDKHIRGQLQRRHERHPFSYFLSGFLADANTDEQAGHLLMMSADLDAHGEDSAICRVLRGEVDLVSLLAAKEV